MFAVITLCVSVKVTHSHSRPVPGNAHPLGRHCLPGWSRKQLVQLGQSTGTGLLRLEGTQLCTEEDDRLIG